MKVRQPSRLQADELKKSAARESEERRRLEGRVEQVLLELVSGSRRKPAPLLPSTLCLHG